MNRIALIAALVVGGAFVVGCSANSSAIPAAAKTGTATGAMTVTGSVSSKLGTDNARAVAIGSNGKQIWTYLDAHGDFTLKLPVGTSYRILVANQLASGGAQKVIGKVAVPTGAVTTQWINAKKETTVDLGILRKPDTTTTTAATATTTKTHSLKIACGCSDDSGGYGDDDDDSGNSGGYGSGGSGSGDDDSGSDWGAASGGGGESDGWGNGFCDDGYGSGYGFDQGGWSDSASGWDNGSDPVVNHNDDNPCFGGDDDDDDSSQGGGWASSSGAGGWTGSSGGSAISDPGTCDVCSGGADSIILAPSNASCGEYGNTEITDKDFPESAVCPSTSSTTATTTSTSSSSTSGAIQALAGSTTTSSVPVGGACVVKAQCGIGDSCIATKCVAN